VGRILSSISNLPVGLALTGRVEARFLDDLDSVDRGVKRLQFTIFVLTEAGVSLQTSP